ncbi:hypothetical protein GJW-30_1_01016 [Variibacter gotjawalensis]|uniref:Uncharacterized protein n=1 Tax=Variibacter gotjawalensis TaxID=1333996 RepID=A0A0S3PRC1_9BRAD|nr:hypothetical protein [Variibacter gotjawalensis]NIK48796.1 hypothetical protein [Variibacter gotjawalensis]RZS50657.1 hypothetical protein EV661_3124 [Variibacter gotjawalensis]BAT58490.1 hypothetical protein GJW-30_1_01016 [Variibacter gotjawalensis]
MRFRRLSIAAVLIAATGSAALAQEPPPGTQRLERREVCTGELVSGNDPDGSWIGARCLLPAGSNVEKAVQRACKPKAVCRVDAVVRAEPGRVVVHRVIKVEQVQAPASEAAIPTEPHGRRLGKLIDGVYAPAQSGCNSRHRPADRVSILLDVAEPTVQFLAQFCAVMVAKGSDPTEKTLRSTLEVRCGPEASEEQMRKGKTGRKTDIVLSRSEGQQLAIDGVPYMACPITQQSTPEWWIKRHPVHQGKIPQ